MLEIVKGEGGWAPPVEDYGWTKVPYCVMVDGRLDAGPKMLLILIMSYSHDGLTWVGTNVLAQNLSAGKSTIAKWLNELEEKKYIRRKTQWVPKLCRKLRIIDCRETWLRALEVATDPELSIFLTIF